MFQVLLPVDMDVQRAQKAAEIIKSLPTEHDSVRVSILNVQKEVDVTGEGGNVSSEDWFDETDFPESALQAKKHLEDADIPVEMVRKHGEPGPTIVKVADEIDADRIVMVGENRSPTGKVLFGSTTQKVLLNSTIPVTVGME